MRAIRSSLILAAALCVVSLGCQSDADGGKKLAAPISPESVRQVASRVTHWQLDQYDPQSNRFVAHHEEDAFIADMDVRGWAYAALHVGISKWAQTVDSKEYFDMLRTFAEKNQYLFAPRIYNADDYAIGQLYIDLSLQDKNPEAITPLKVIFNQILANPYTLDMDFVKAEGAHDSFGGVRFAIQPSKNRWSWADATFMGPPVWMHLAEITGDKRYLDFADSEFWTMAEILYDKDERLFLRDTRFLEKRDEDGKKVFWGRGNGWVIAGLARMLEHLPQDHPSRPRYESLYRDFAARVAELQWQDGFWRPSLLNPQAFPSPDSSGSGFFVYGLAWGVNNGLLDAKTYSPAIEKGWQALTGAVHKDGKLGWVQQVAAKPGSTTFDDTQLYGVGAFLLAASEMYEMAGE